MLSLFICYAILEEIEPNQNHYSGKYIGVPCKNICQVVKTGYCAMLYCHMLDIKIREHSLKFNTGGDCIRRNISCVYMYFSPPHQDFFVHTQVLVEILIRLNAKNALCSIYCQWILPYILSAILPPPPHI